MSNEPTGDRLANLLEVVARDNPFYRAKLGSAGFDPAAIAARSNGAAASPHAMLAGLPFTTKDELVEDRRRHPPFGTGLTYPVDRYTRIHRTSGTTGSPLYWLDTAESWAWWLDCWRAVYDAAGVTARDRVFVPFSFGPFVGFWAAWDAGDALGAMMIPGGGMSSTQRLDLLYETGATVLVCTPTYALRLARDAREAGIDLADGPARVTIHAGEPGAGIPAVRQRIEAAWGARAVDHAGATEVGAWGYGCGEGDRMHVHESEFVAEVVDPETEVRAVPDDDGFESGELVLTNLGRTGSPLIRYRTGDRVALSRTPCPCGRTTAWLRGGVVGRVDDMLVVRGVNVFPSAIENVVRSFDTIEEFEVHRATVREMAALTIRVETTEPDVPERVRRRLRERLGIDTRVERVDPGTLPRYDLKARRFRR